MTLFVVLGWIVAMPALIMGITFSVEMLFGLIGGRQRSLRTIPSIAIIMPAHNEASGIGEILSRLSGVLPARAHILVIADNCTDGTAAIARSMGVQVLERTDPERRGKGYALAFGRDHLRDDPPDCVIVLDSDCLPERGAIEVLAAAAMAEETAVQSAYLFRPAPKGAPPMLEISGFAFLIKNLVRQRGLMRLGAPVILTGSGMAFPWQMYRDADLATGNIVEDLALGIALTRQGNRPIFSEARVWTDPSTAGGTLIQRTRWENGFIGTAMTQALPLIAKGVNRLNPQLLWLGLHLAVPPLALLLMLCASTLVFEALIWWLSGASAPFVAVAILVGAMAILLMIAWTAYGREQMRASTFLRIPLYILWKIPVYLKLAKGGETQWVRTERKDEG